MISGDKELSFNGKVPVGDSYVKIKSNGDVAINITDGEFYAVKDYDEIGVSINSSEEPALTREELAKKIAELEKMVENAVVIKEVDTDKVSIGTSVKIEYVDDGETESYMVVGSKEADPFENKISNESPIAQAIMGKKIGDVVSVASPNGQYSVKILEIA